MIVQIMITIVVLLSKAQNYMLILSPRNSRKLSKLLSKGFERLVQWNQHRTTSENKNVTN